MSPSNRKCILRCADLAQWLYIWNELNMPFDIRSFRDRTLTKHGNTLLKINAWAVGAKEKSEDLLHFQDAVVHLRYKVKQLAVTLWPLCPACVVWPRVYRKTLQESSASMIQCLTFKSRESDPEREIISKQFQASNRAMHSYASSNITIGFTATRRFGVVAC